MQDIILEPFGAQVLHLSVSGTTILTALLAAGALAAFALAARALAAGIDPYRLAALGVVCGPRRLPLRDLRRRGRCARCCSASAWS